MATPILPMTEAQLAKFKPENARYMTGHPRVYRFDAKSGRFSDPAGDHITAAGDAFKFVPISYRLFEAELFEYTRRVWLEAFFLNEKGHVCTILFHGFSADEFVNCCAALYYENASVNEAVFTATPLQREKLLKDGKKFKYYIAAFGIQPLKGKAAKQPAAVIDSLPPVFRRDTVRSTQNLLRWEGYPELPEVSGGELPESVTESETSEETK